MKWILISLFFVGLIMLLSYKAGFMGTGSYASNYEYDEFNTENAFI